MTSKEAILKARARTGLPVNIECAIITDTELKLVEKDLEVLEIIKNKLVFPLALMSLPYELYNNSVIQEQKLTQEEYDKVKEYFKKDGGVI